MCRIYTPVWRIVGEFITLGTLYNDMGIDCMEINGIQGGQITPDRDSAVGDCEDHTMDFFLIYVKKLQT